MFLSDTTVVYQKYRPIKVQSKEVMQLNFVLASSPMGPSNLRPYAPYILLSFYPQTLQYF